MLHAAASRELAQVELGELIQEQILRLDSSQASDQSLPPGRLQRLESLENELFGSDGNKGIFDLAREANDTDTAKTENVSGASVEASVTD